MSDIQTMKYNKCGESGLKLPAVSLGLWHNFGTNADLNKCSKILKTAYNSGITHFDLANNYGPIAGAAEQNFGKILKTEFAGLRDRIVISTKAGYYMWEGPYGEWGSKKHLVSSLDQSLKRMDIDYVDIFYHHRPDPNTPIEETANALDLIVRQGKALYIGISNYSAKQTEEIIKVFNRLNTPFIIHQAVYSMLNRGAEKELINTLKQNKKGLIVYSPLAQGLLTDRYIKGIPQESRAKTSHFLNEESVRAAMPKIIKLNEIAKSRGQTLAQMSLSWLLNNKTVTSVLIGVSTTEQLKENLKAVDFEEFTPSQLKQIDDITL